ncbi:MAG: endonuclease, partial [Saprospiraceae bacterium]
MKHFNFCEKSTFIFILFSLSFSNIFQAQIPPDSLSGEDLRVWFKTNWFDGLHTTLGYDGVNGARSYMYNIIDNHNDTVTCVYSGHKEYRAYDLTRAAGTPGMTPINCEHSIPQSFFGYLEPMKSDIHHLYPAYQSWNSTRSNHPFADIVDADTEKWMHLISSQTSIPASNIDLFSEFKSGYFEPREDHKGNLARAIFYFYTMYPTEAGNMSLLGDINTFYQWHLNDAEDALEYQRDDDIYTYQGNANPYLSNPGWMTRVFELGNLPPPELAFNATASSITISWGDMPTETGYKIYRSIDDVTYNQIGTTLNADTVKFIDNTALQNTTYYYHVTGEYSGGSSVPSGSVSGMLLPAIPPNAVSNLALTVGATSLDLTWSDVEGEEFYQLYRSTDNSIFNPLGAVLSSNTTSYSDNSAVAGTNYY